MRLDLILANGALARRCVETGIGRQERTGKQPSDHIPVRAMFAD